MRHALITGSNSGIGLAAAVLFARRGFRVYATLRNPDRADAIRRAVASEGLDVQILPLDVTNAESVKSCLERVHAECGALDVLINNAGVGGAGPLEEVAESEHRSIFEVNYFGAIRMIQGVVPRMRERRQGAIINVSSVVGRVPMVGQAPYSASKQALEAASESLAQELVAHGVRVALIEPGVFQTQIWENSEPTTHYDKQSPYRSAMRRNGRFYSRMLKTPGDPADVAEAILTAVTSSEPKLRYVVGWDAEHLIAGRERISDEEWVALCDDLDDAEYSARFKAYFGIDL